MKASSPASEISDKSSFVCVKHVEA